MLEDFIHRVKLCESGEQVDYVVTLAVEMLTDTAFDTLLDVAIAHLGVLYERSLEV